MVAAGATVPEVRPMRWGLVPSWARDRSIGARLINARSESAAEKPAFRAALAKRRCIVPADGFYEWKSIVGSRQKQPMFLYATDRSLLAMAGLWETWTEAGARTGQDVWHTFTILTTNANAAVAPVHDRMPVLLPPSRWSQWLAPGSLSETDRREILAPAPEKYLRQHPVSSAVNDARREGPELCEVSEPLVNDLGF